MRSVALIGFAAVCLAASIPAHAQSPEIRQMHAQMLSPAVQIESARAQGSGTVVYSKEKDGKVETFVLTNFHVVEGAVTLVEEYDTEKRAMAKRERRDTVTVRFHRYANESRHTGSDNRTAYIAAYDKGADLALLRLDDDTQVVPNVAKVAAPNARVDRGEHVWAVGGGLGNAPFATEGLLGSTGHQIDGHPYMMATAPIIFGNSGGALYHRSESGDYELIGIPSRVASTGNMFVTTAITHIGWHIQLDTVRAFLARHKLSYVLE